ncbi:MAG TPA: hypothetical protein VEB22_11180 [Phycisphaerales bacterium]|nr:hypothetical protein [Phycisphaerales bacterium]
MEKVTVHPTLRNLTLTLHIMLSVGWLGAAAAYLVVAVAALTSGQPQRMRDAYPVLSLIGWWAIVPLCGAALSSGVAQSVGTHWGLFRHWWVVAKLGLTLLATGVLLAHMPAVSAAAAGAARASVHAPTTHGHGSGGHAVPVQIVIHAAGGLIVLATIAAVSVFKPWGLTPRGRRLRAASVSGLQKKD